jgi:hypothetical protein
MKPVQHLEGDCVPPIRESRVSNRNRWAFDTCLDRVDTGRNGSQRPSSALLNALKQIRVIGALCTTFFDPVECSFRCSPMSSWIARSLGSETNYKKGRQYIVLKGRNPTMCTSPMTLKSIHAQSPVALPTAGMFLIIF